LFVRDGLSSEVPTTAPANTPMAAATTATRSVRLKRGSGAK
jgi:hypothetical protein